MTDKTQDNSHIANTATIKGFGEVRILWPDTLLEAKPYTNENGKEVGEPRHSCLLLLTPEQKKLLEPFAIAAARKKWPDRALNELKFPFKSGDKIAAKREDKGKDGDLYADKVVLTPKAYPDRFSPADNVAVLKNGLICRAEKSDLYSGMVGHAKIAFAAYKGQRDEDKDGVTVYLRSIVKTGEGERVGGSTAFSDFSGIAGRETDEDPTGSGGDDIPIE